ncbi:immunoglobulin superfamily member 5 [Cheilinus undulatus]|uniref:immunoglobulin superfamily member 5 n=1 Tax=Cheilinus undulatus TaxID=241271 RepID=UPI001BD2DDC4|nr:immunoglobulin superfamily member 5 [Cheilinus undulatus]XP_041658076.1 immunoglobulin superfamily member 5 [Cheilinus undulatus]
MTQFWKSSWATFFCILSLLSATGDSAGPNQFQLEPLNSTVLRGSDVKFNATLQGNWQVMTWIVAGLLVVTVPVSGDVTSSSQRFTAGFCSTGDTGCVEFTMRNVSRGDAGPIVCIVQGEYGSKTAQLSVQESGSVNITAGNLKVEEDEQVQFQCVMSAWFPAPTVSWALNGQLVDSSLFNTTFMVDGDSYNSTSVLDFKAVKNTTVECRATVETLTNPQKSSVFLVVVPKPPDWTVLISMVVSIGGFALLVLLIIGIIFCYKHRKEKQPTYEDEMRRVRTQSQLSAVTGTPRGQVNRGYVNDGQTSVAPSEHTDSGFSQANGSSYFEMPDVVNSNQAGNVFRFPDAVDESGFKKHRHVTIV